jgi:hypothetical protein
MRRIFCGFYRNWFLINPLHYLLSLSNFGFEFTEIFIIEKQPRLGESATLRLGGGYGESGSRYSNLLKFIITLNG